MVRLIRTSLFHMATLLVVMLGWQTAASQEMSREEFLSVGRDLFAREWKPGEPASPGGDGLGPNFNDVSCLACHNLGGIGGAGPIEKNVDMLSLPPRTKMLTRVQLRRLQQLHPGFLLKDGEINSSIVLHRFSIKPEYGSLRQQIVGEVIHAQPHGIVRDLMQRQLAATPLHLVSSANLQLVRSQRNTTALFGAAVIDAIPGRVLAQLERQQDHHPEVSGRVAFTDMGAGHFGWRGGTRRLHDFVLAACGNEVGLRVPGVDQAMVPDAPEYQPVGFDMSPAQSAAMIAFVASLPRPVQSPPRSPSHATVIANGLATFEKIGCAVCHVPNPGGVPGVFSDLLLHDMGPGLTDPAPAPKDRFSLQAAMDFAVANGLALPEEVRPQEDQAEGGQPGGGQKMIQRSAASSGSYGGGQVSVSSGSVALGSGKAASQELIEIQTTNIFQEWRTPPLWGVQDSAPYLHDGRAASLTEAIVMHGGEAKPSAARFLALDYVSRRAVLEFLGTLRSPFFEQQ